MVEAGGIQTVGLRFNGLAIPPGASVSAAYVQFTADEVDSGALTLTIQGQLSPNPPAFQQNKRDISDRPRTLASVPWIPPGWLLVGESGPGQRTSDLTAILQEIVSQPGWSSGNAVVLIVTGTANRRTAFSWDGSPGMAPLLHVEFTASESLAGQDAGFPAQQDVFLAARAILKTIGRAP